MKSFLVLGLGKFGKSMAQTLYDLGFEVMGADMDEKNVNDFSRYITHTVQADITSEEFLKSVDIQKFDAAVVATGSSIQVSIMATVLLKELGARYILVKAQDEFAGKVLYKLGADKVILPEKDIGVKAAHNLASDHFYEMIEISSDYSISSVSPPDSWIGKTLGEIAVRTRHGLNVLAIKDQRDRITIPDANTVITEDCVITLMGSNENLKKFGNLK